MSKRNGEARFQNLLRVVPAEPQPDEAIQVLGLELYDDGLAVRWGALPSEPGIDNAGLNPVQLTSETFGAFPSILPDPFPETISEDPGNPLGLSEVSDDLGTTYEQAGSSGEAIRGLAYFTPALPGEASWLEVHMTDGTIRFDL